MSSTWYEFKIILYLLVLLKEFWFYKKKKNVKSPSFFLCGFHSNWCTLTYLCFDLSGYISFNPHSTISIRRLQAFASQQAHARLHISFSLRFNDDVIAFSATTILMIRSKERWTNSLLYSLSFLPVGIFALAFFPLYLSLSKTYKYLLKKIMEAFPCRTDTYFFYGNLKAEIRSSSIRLQGGSNTNSCRDNSVGEHGGCHDTSQTMQFSV